MAPTPGQDTSGGFRLGQPTPLKGHGFGQPHWSQLDRGISRPLASHWVTPQAQRGQQLVLSARAGGAGARQMLMQREASPRLPLKTSA